MQPVLFIAYQFAPKNSPGVHRSIRFAKNLTKYGYNPIVLTIDQQSIEQENSKIDLKLLEGLEHIKIERLSSGVPHKLIQQMMRLRVYRFFWFFAYGWLWEYSLFWNKSAYKKAQELIEQHNIKLVYTSSGPFSVFPLAAKLKKRLGIKWVADLRDPFTDAYAWQFPTKMHWYAMRWWERIYFRKPDRLVVNTDAVKTLFLKRKLIDDQKISVINNGF